MLLSDTNPFVNLELVQGIVHSDFLGDFIFPIFRRPARGLARRLALLDFLGSPESKG